MRRVVVGLAITFGTLAPSWLRADDQQIAQEIVEKLKVHQSQGELHGFKIDLQVDQGTVLLTGRVADARQQQLALDVARRVEGVTQVVNDLAVAEPVASRSEAAGLDDAAPKRFALSGLTRLKLLGERHEANRPALEARDEEAPRSMLGALRRGSKTPSDIMQTAAQQPTAAQPVSATRTAHDPSDEQIAQQIYKKLQQFKDNGELQGFQLNLKVEEGSVWLEGHVSSDEQKSKAIEMARRIPGVYQVVDAIRVDRSGRKVIPASTQTSRRVSANAPATLDPAVASPLSPAPGYGVPGAVPAAAVPMAAHYASGGGVAPVRYDHPYLPNYAWPSYAAYPNYAAVTYPRQYSASAWPYIGPFYPYPQVPLGWRKVQLEWDDGWWHLDFCEK